MRRTLVLVAGLIVVSLGAIAEPIGVTLGQDATPRPGASPTASPAACAAGTPLGRLVAVPNEVAIRMTDEGFDPAVIQSTNNADMRITLVNTGSRPHAFVLDDYEVRVELAPGEREEISLTPIDRDAAVTHEFFSDLPGDECLRGRLIFYI